jgi:hypothetical protein
VGQPSGLVRKLHRRGKRRRDKLRLALRVVGSLVVLAIAVLLSAGVIHVVERPVPPFESIAERLPHPVVDPTIPEQVPEADLAGD